MTKHKNWTERVLYEFIETKKNKNEGLVDLAMSGLESEEE